MTTSSKSFTVGGARVRDSRGRRAGWRRNLTGYVRGLLGMLLAAPSLIGVIATPGIAHAATGVVTTNFAYVANSQNNTVAVVNLSTSSVVDTISGFSQPGAMAASPNGQYVYVANYFGNTVSVISTATNSVVATIAVGGSPSGIAVTPNGQYLYVSNLTGDGSGSSTDPLASSVSVISTTTNSVVSTIGLYDSGPAGLAMSPAGDYVYVANDLSASISIISTATNTVVQTFTNLPAPNSTTFNPVSVGVEPDGKYVYFGEANYGQYIGLLSVSSSGPSSDTFSILGGVYTQQIAGFAFNSTTAVAIQGNFSSSAEYFPWGHTAISPAASVVGLANPSAVAVSPDGSTFYITNANNSTVSVVPASSISSNTNGLVTPPRIHSSRLRGDFGWNRCGVHYQKHEHHYRVHERPDQRGRRCDLHPAGLRNVGGLDRGQSRRDLVGMCRALRSGEFPYRRHVCSRFH